jgi:L-ribulose-5-phosphate 3-epimerase
MKTRQLGVMQGRLLPKYQGRYQAHPVEYWQDEFPNAAKLGLDIIEFILDYNEVKKNPLMSDAGVEEIRILSAKTGVGVISICADYFMEAPFHSLSDEVVIKSSEVLKTLMSNASRLGVADVVIPCVDQSSLENKESIERFIHNIQPSIALAEDIGINLSLETDLPPAEFKSLIDQLGSKRVTVNYDSGNSAALGYKPIEEFAAYGDRITDVHVKDRMLNGGSVVLGTGETNFPEFLDCLNQINYSGPIIMQAYRDDEGTEIFKRQLEWIIPMLESSQND